MTYACPRKAKVLRGSPAFISVGRHLFSSSLHRIAGVPVPSNLMVFRIVVPLLCCPMATDLVVDLDGDPDNADRPRYTLIVNLPASAFDLAQLVESGQIVAADQIAHPSPPVSAPRSHLRLERA